MSTVAPTKNLTIATQAAELAGAYFTPPCPREHETQADRTVHPKTVIAKEVAMQLEARRGQEGGRGPVYSNIAFSRQLSTGLVYPSYAHSST